MEKLILALFGKYLNGYKTYIGIGGLALIAAMSGLGDVLSGVLGICETIWPDTNYPGIDPLSIDAAKEIITVGFTKIFGAFAGLGGAHKIQKIGVKK